jgi:hypothetical protein
MSRGAEEFFEPVARNFLRRYGAVFIVEICSPTIGVTNRVGADASKCEIIYTKRVQGGLCVFPEENRGQNEHKNDYRTLGTGLGVNPIRALLASSCRG